VPVEGSRPRRNPIQSVLTALPILMLVAGLYYYHRTEQAQQASAPIRQEAKTVTGLYTGQSVVKSGLSERHYLWYADEGRPHGVRVTGEQAKVLASLVKEQPIAMDVAPTVAGSKTLWVLRVEQHGDVIFEASAAAE